MLLNIISKTRANSRITALRKHNLAMAMESCNPDDNSDEGKNCLYNHRENMKALGVEMAEEETSPHSQSQVRGSSRLVHLSLIGLSKHKLC